MAECIRRAARGEQPACGQLYQRFHASVRRVAQGYAALGTAEVEDVVQETFVRAFRELPRLQHPRAFSGWLLTIARHHAYALSRGAKARERVEESMAREAEVTAPALPPSLTLERRVAVVRDRHDGRGAVAAEPLAERAEADAAALPGLLLPLLALLPAAALIVHLLLRQGFRSLEPARAALARRDGTDLSRLPADGLPRELQPLVEAVNALLVRVAALVTAERQFAAAGAHELRTPLAAARAQLQRLIEELPAGVPGRDRALALERQLRRLSDLGAKLLQLARVDAGVGLAREPVELQALVRLVLDEFRRGGEEAASRWRLALPEAPVWVAGDLDALGIALRNRGGFAGTAP